MVNGRILNASVAVVLLVAIVAVAARWHLSKEQQWKAVVVTLLEERLNYELHQIYWVWQQQGRPNVVSYRPDVKEDSVEIAISSRGKPEFEMTEENCRKLFFAIIGQKELKKYFNMSTHTEEQVSIAIEQDQCTYKVWEHLIAYNAELAQFSPIR